jgi:hypothetical protein
MPTEKPLTNRDDKASDQSIVRRPWAFACKWYSVDEVFNAINRENRFRQVGDVPKVPADVTSREFAEWLTGQYRLAMRKGAELAVSEMKQNNDGAACPNCGEPSEMFTSDMDWCPKCKRQWYV